MDVERTIEFILQSQAKAEARMGATDRRLEAIAKLLQQGARMLVQTDTKLKELAAAQKLTDIKFKELADAQKAMQKSLKAFIDSLRHSRNGH
jgi:DNA replicative helicase MCM subunit Mcm2 (Cdc46/Mcm family)